MPRTASVSREHVLDVAGSLFYSQGVRATGVSEVIMRTGCGKQALYRLFPSKDDLVAAYLGTVVSEREASADRAVTDAGDDPGRQLVALTENVASWAVRPGFRGCAMRNYLREYPTEKTMAKRVAERYLRRARRRVAQLAMQAGPDAGPRTADTVWLVHEAMYSNSRANPVNLAAGIELVVELVRRPATSPE